jgi:biopolymer transport protein ExbB
MLLSTLLQITTAPAITDTMQKAAAVPQTLQAAATAPTEQTLSLLDLIMKGGVIMIPLAILSLLTIYFLVERILAIKKARKIDPNFMNNIRDFIHTGNIEAAKSLSKNTPGPQARMIEKGISRIGKPIKEIESAVENVGKMEVAKLEKNLGILGIVAGIAPMFGFIGTIIGVIKIFYNISLQDSISIGAISGGLYEKMITSASGLMIGVFAFVGYHILNMMVDKTVRNMESGAVEFIDLLQEPAK